MRITLVNQSIRVVKVIPCYIDSDHQKLNTAQNGSAMGANCAKTVFEERLYRLCTVSVYAQKYRAFLFARDYKKEKRLYNG